MTYSSPTLLLIGSAQELVLGFNILGRPFKDNLVCAFIPLSRNVNIC